MLVNLGAAGTCTTAQGDVYEGDWVAGLRQGHGRWAAWGIPPMGDQGRGTCSGCLACLHLSQVLALASPALPHLLTCLRCVHPTLSCAL